MNLKELQQVWNQFGKIDPLWYILTHPGKKGNKWAKKEFFKTGEKEIEEILQKLRKLGIDIEFGTALDFGCGVGRNTFPLSRYFKKVIGVDIAPSMIKLAKKNECECEFFINDRSDLKIFETNYFDFIYSGLTLQHIHPKYSKRYIQEFTRIAKPSGIIIFQIPSSFNKNVKNFLKFIRIKGGYVYYRIIGKNIPKKPLMEMHCISKKKISKIIKDNNCKLIHRYKDHPGAPFKSYIYFIKKLK